MINPELVHEIGIGLGVLAPTFGAVIIRLGKNSKLVALFQREQGKGNVRAKKLVSHAGDEFVFVPTAGNASFSDLALREEQINKKVAIPSMPGAMALYTGHEGMIRIY